MKRPIDERPLHATLQKSYYGKAVVITNGDEIALRSYNTIVASYNTATGELKRLWNGWSATTAKHINDFLMSLNLPTLNKKAWLSLPCDNDTPVYNVTISNGFTSHTAPALLTADECESTIEKIRSTRPHVMAWYD